MTSEPTYSWRTISGRRVHPEPDAVAGGPQEAEHMTLDTQSATWELMQPGNNRATADGAVF